MDKAALSGIAILYCTVFSESIIGHAKAVYASERFGVVLMYVFSLQLDRTINFATSQRPLSIVTKVSHQLCPAFCSQISRGTRGICASPFVRLAGAVVIAYFWRCSYLVAFGSGKKKEQLTPFSLTNPTNILVSLTSSCLHHQTTSLAGEAPLIT